MYANLLYVCVCVHILINTRYEIQLFPFLLPFLFWSWHPPSPNTAKTFFFKLTNIIQQIGHCSLSVSVLSVTKATYCMSVFDPLFWSRLARCENVDQYLNGTIRYPAGGLIGVKTSLLLNILRQEQSLRDHSFTSCNQRIKIYSSEILNGPIYKYSICCLSLILIS